METRGRKPKPAHLLAKFDPDKRPDAVIQAHGIPRKPEGLNADGSEFWDHVIAELIDMNVVGCVDEPQLTAMTEWWQEYRYWCRQVPDHRTVVAKSKAYQQFLAVSAKFGLSPMDRRKLKPRAPKEVVSPFSAFLQAKQALANG